MATWDDSFAFTVGAEGGLSMDATDPGNWTGGKVGVGQLKGTKYGISAAAFPDEDIANLTLDRAKVLAKAGYWDPLHCDALPAALAGVVFDTAYNQGVHAAAVLLQGAVGVQQDGDVGPVTLKAVYRTPLRQMLSEFSVLRILSYTQDALWPQDGHGWTRRAIAGLLRAAA